MKELSATVTRKLEEVVEEWADENLDGKPALLATFMLSALKNKMLEKQAEIEKEF